MSALFITSFIASRQGYDRVGKFIDLTRFDALVDDFNRPWSGYHLREAIENASIRVIFFSPGRYGQPLGASISRFPAAH